MEIEGVLVETFVRLANRPSFPYAAIADENGSHIVKIPSDIKCTILDANINGYSLTKREAPSGFLRLYDGCGGIIEVWTFTNIVVEFTPEDCENEYVDIDVNVKYESSSYVGSIGE